MLAFRRWFVAHWFLGIHVILGGVWLVTLVAYAVGAGGIRFGNRFAGQDATIDFQREHEQTVLALRHGVGRELDAGAGAAAPLHASIVQLEDGLPVFCWVCGDQHVDEGIATAVQHRQGDWFYRAPKDQRGVTGREAYRKAQLTLAYNRATGERVIAAPNAGVAGEAALLAARGLVVSEPSRIRPATLTDLTPVSMMSEGCVVFNAAFLAAALLWLAIGGPIALLLRARRRRVTATTTSTRR